tara:strand:+ start:25923 stop:26363 length:441 start_codon:yes stop_codon:yes gene_type:complete
MFKWMDQLQIPKLQQAKTEMSNLLSSKSTKEFELKMEAILEKLSTNPQLLNTLSIVLNTQSQIKSLVNFSFEKLWKNVQLPNKKDQERTLYMLHELQFKIHQMEKEVLRLKRPYGDISNINQKSAEPRTITVLEKRKADQPISKMV